MFLRLVANWWCDGAQPTNARGQDLTKYNEIAPIGTLDFDCNLILQLINFIFSLKTNKKSSENKIIGPNAKTDGKTALTWQKYCLCRWQTQRHDRQPMLCHLCARPINVSKTLATWALSALKARGRKNLRPKLKFRKCYQLSLIFFRTLNSKIMEFIGLNKLKSARDSKNWSFLAIS